MAIRLRVAARELGIWVICLLLVSVFVPAGLAKFDETSGWSRAFAHWGYPVWFRMLVGVVEIAGALLLLWPRTAAYGAAAIAVIMLGGMGTHVLVEHRPSRITSELLQLVFAAIILWTRWSIALKPFRGTTTTAIRTATPRCDHE